MLFLAVLVVCTAQSLQLDSQASTRRPRVTKYSKTTVAPGGSTVRISNKADIIYFFPYLTMGMCMCVVVFVAQIQKY